MKSYKARILQIYPGALLMASMDGEGLVYIVDTYKGAFSILIFRNAFYDQKLFEEYKTSIWKSLWLRLQEELENKLAE